MGGILYLGTNHGKLPKTLMAWSRKNLTVKVTALKAICFRLGIPVTAKVFKLSRMPRKKLLAEQIFAAKYLSNSKQ